jgi:hypothetical protein
MPSRWSPSAVAFMSVLAVSSAAQLTPTAAHACGWHDPFSAQRETIARYFAKVGRSARPVAWCADPSDQSVCVTAEWRGNADERWRADVQLVSFNITEWKVAGESAWRRQADQ